MKKSAYSLYSPSLFYSTTTCRCYQSNRKHPLVSSLDKASILADDLEFPYNALDLLVSAEGLVNWTNHRKARINIMWSMPAIEELKWNVDCSAFGKTGRTRIGGVLRDHKGVVLCLFSAFVGIKESNKTELLGVLKALELAASSE